MAIPPDAPEESFTPAPDSAPGVLEGVRVIEISDESAEYCGVVLAGLGADVVKIEPPEGAPSRRIGPFYGDIPNPEKSLFFWNYNRTKRSCVLDLKTPAGRDNLLRLLADADILLDGSNGAVNAALGLDRTAVLKKFPSLVVARLTPFGDDGPWRDFKGSDLIHLALGGVMMNCGYDPDPSGRYDLPPIAPQIWQAYQIAGDQLAIGIIAALLSAWRTGQGQDVSVAVHEAVAKNTENDVMSWVMRRAPYFRQTCRHAAEVFNRVPTIASTKDGRWYIHWITGARDEMKLVPFLEKYGMAADLKMPGPEVDLKARNIPGRPIPGTQSSDEHRVHVYEVIQRFVRSFRYEDYPWRDVQDAGMLCVPLRKPHENAVDEHWLKRRSFADLHHPALGRSFRYATSKWLSTATSWRVGPPAPALGAHTDAVLKETPRNLVAGRPRGADGAAARVSRRGRPFALQGVRILDFSWFLASAGGTRFLNALGAESIKIEWKASPDTRLGNMAPVGGRAARDAATAPLKGVTDPDMGGQFSIKNSGKRGISLNIRHPDGLKIAKDLLRICDVVAEGFSPGVLDRAGFGYEVQKSIKPDIVYVQQSGMGSYGEYGRFRTVGPIAAAFTGMSEMSGFPEPAMPAGWGYSFLDWTGAYGFALAILGGLYHRARTGQGQRIDSSQCESGIFLAGAAVLDWSANGREWRRIGNRSPYKPAAPHGAYRCRGADRWIAIACFDDAQWRALAQAAGHPEWLADPRFATLEARLAHQDALDACITAWTQGQDDYECMMTLQKAGVPAGACQNMEDRYDRDPQLKTLQWMTEIAGTKLGSWPFPELSMKLSETPSHIGGVIDRAAPCYGEDNEYVLGELLGIPASKIRDLATEGVI